MIVKGGRTNYGQDIGILMLNTIFPRIPGDIGNANTYPGIPVRYKIVEGADPSRIMGKDPDLKLLEPFILGAQELEREGCKAITTSCGFLSRFQRELADCVTIPVFTSALMLIPLIRQMINSEKEIGVFTERAWNMTPEHFSSLGFTIESIPVAISGMPEGSPFPAVFIDNVAEGDIDVFEDCIKELTERHMKEHPNTGAIVFECTNFGPFTDVVSKISGLPVFGINQLIEFVHSTVNPPAYYRNRYNIVNY